MRKEGVKSFSSDGQCTEHVRSMYEACIYMAYRLCSACGGRPASVVGEQPLVIAYFEPPLSLSRRYFAESSAECCIQCPFLYSLPPTMVWVIDRARKARLRSTSIVADRLRDSFAIDRAEHCTARSATHWPDKRDKYID